MSQRDNYIGVFDSGIGGLTVARSIIEKMPNEKIIYFGDTAHLPYGTKSEKQIKRFVMDDVRFLTQFDIKALVIACNTADSVARKTVQENFDLPIFGVIKPASKRAARLTKNNRIGIMATAATVRTGAYVEKIHRYNPEAEVFQLACPLLVPLVENSRYKADDPVVKIVLNEYLDQLREKDVDTIVLGCTHYPLLEDAVRTFVPEMTVISSSEAAAQTLLEGLKERNLDRLEGCPEHKYYVSDDPEHFTDNARIFMGEEFTGEAELYI